MNSAKIRGILPPIFLAFFVNFLLLQIPQSTATERSFQVDRKNNVFLKDGRPFRYISGEIHYFRIHPSLWQDRLHRVRAMGLNAVQVYIPWNYHEAKPGNFNFGGDRDVAQFLRLAQQNELDVLLRIGPYVCAELEFGGMPWWLVKDQADIQLRVHNEKYLQYVERYFNVLLQVLQPLLYKNGGPILMIQIENEYGSVLCDHAYTKWLRDLVRARLGQDVVLYTTDGPTEWMTTCGAVEDTFTTVDFGPPQTEDSVKNHFAIQRKHSGGGPNVNSEFYTMWFSMWGDTGLFRQQIEPVMNALELMWKQNASFSLYMVHGGTNFGFWNGRETNGPVITSYDYAAPISEEGQVTPLFEAIRNWIGTKANWPNPPLPIPSNRTGVSINNVMAVRLNNFIKILNSTTFGQSHQCLSSSGKPLNFEQFDRDHAFVWYSTTLDKGGSILQIPDLHDHGYVFLDGKFMGNLSICDKTGCVKNVTLLGRLGQRLDILVESAGRLTYPLTKVDPKGILSNVLLDGKPIGQKWLQCGVDFEGFYSMALQEHFDLLESMENEGFDEVLNEPAIYVAKFNTHGIDWTQMHTFFDSRGWGHGVAIVNGFNIGRYWPLLGPQTSLFVPGAVMKNENFVVLLELTGRQKADSNIQFVAEPVLKFGEDLFPTANPSTNDDVDDIQTRDTAEISGYKRKYEMAWALHRRRLLRQRNSFAAKANNRLRHSSFMSAFQQNEEKFMNFLSHF